MSEKHIAARPSWDCLTCREPWPCWLARKALAASMPSMQLGMFTWMCLEEAAGDLPDLTPADLYDRFLAWMRPAQDVRDYR